jgi:hypothetical protein
MFHGERDAVWRTGVVQVGRTADMPGVGQFRDEFAASMTASANGFGPT